MLEKPQLDISDDDPTTPYSREEWERVTRELGLQKKESAITSLYRRVVGKKAG